MINSFNVATDGLLGTTLAIATRGLLGGLEETRSSSGSARLANYRKIVELENEELILIASMAVNVIGGLHD